MEVKAEKRFNIKIPVIFVVSVLAVLLFFVFGSAKAEAKAITIKTPEDLQNINWKNKGFGPGNTYVIGNDMTLGDQDDSTCLLTKGDFVIDFNGHTVQNASLSNTVFKVAGANVVMQDSKALNSKPSVRSYGLGAVQITGGKLTINSGVYYGASNGQNNPGGLHVGGGTCIVNNGYFLGDYIGASCAAGGKLYINGGTFRGGFPFALADMGNGNIKITKGTFISGQTNYGYCFAFGAYAVRSTYDFSQWFVNGYKIDPGFETAYWNMQSQLSYQPFYASYYAVSYNTPQITVTTPSITPPKTSITSLSHKGSTLNVAWKKQTSKTTGYYAQISTNSKFTSGVKTVNVKTNAKTTASFSGIKSNTMYYVRVRTYRSYNGGTVCSGWVTGSYNPTAPKISKPENISGGVSVTWGKIKGATRYSVFRKTGNGSWTKIANVGNVSVYKDKTAKSGTKYTYTVRGLSTDGKSYVSPFNSGSAVTYVAPPAISKINNTKNGVKLTWNKPKGAVKFRVFRKTGSGKWTKISDTTALSFTDQTAKNATTYQYCVRCINATAKAYTSAAGSAKSIKCAR